MNTLGRILRVFTLVLLLVGGLEIPSATVSAVSLDTTADRVFGQTDFTSNVANNGGVSAHSLDNPFGVALDAAGNLYVADRFNHRVLEYDAPLTGNRTADRVFGQPDFTSNAENNGGVSAHSLAAPGGVALDAEGNLYVADYANNRVLEYDTPLTGDTTADRVFGQPDFTSNVANNGGVSAHSLNYPAGTGLDAMGNLYVGDRFNHRVLEYDTPLTGDTTADRVFGQPDFTSNMDNNGGVSATSLNFPGGVALDAAGNLYVADRSNHRVLEYDTPLTGDKSADRVLGQPDFTSNLENNGGVNASSLNWPFGVALDAAGNLYVADRVNNRALEYDGARWKTFLPYTRR